MAHQWNGGPVEVRNFSARHIFYVTYNVGHAVVREDDGTWIQLDLYPQDSVMWGYSATLPGGYIGPISDEHYSELVASGFGDYIDEV